MDLPTRMCDDIVRPGRTRTAAVYTRHRDRTALANRMKLNPFNRLLQGMVCVGAVKCGKWAGGAVRALLRIAPK